MSPRITHQFTFLTWHI